MSPDPTVVSDDESEGDSELRLFKDMDPPTENISLSFQLGAILFNYDIGSTSETVIYEGALADGFHHTICHSDVPRLVVHDYIFVSNFRRTSPTFYQPLWPFGNGVRVGISSTDAHALARPKSLSPVQQELMD